MGDIWRGLPERAGLLVQAVKEGSAADRAGLEGGDLLVTAARQPLESLDDLFGVLDRAGPSLDLTVVRALDERQVTVAWRRRCDGSRSEGSKHLT